MNGSTDPAIQAYLGLFPRGTLSQTVLMDNMIHFDKTLSAYTLIYSEQKPLCTSAPDRKDVCVDYIGPKLVTLIHSNTFLYKDFQILEYFPFNGFCAGLVPVSG